VTCSDIILQDEQVRFKRGRVRKVVKEARNYAMAYIVTQKDGG
jgi:hypothetical protein